MKRTFMKSCNEPLDDLFCQEFKVFERLSFTAIYRHMNETKMTVFTYNQEKCLFFYIFLLKVEPRSTNSEFCMTKRFLILLLIVFQFFPSRAQIDTSFWFVAPDI